MSNNFHSLIGVLWVNWNGICVEVVSAFLKHSLLITVTNIALNPWLNFYSSDTSHLCFLLKKTWVKRSLFCYVRSYSGVWISNDFSKVLAKFWKNQITVGHLFISRGLTPVSWIFTIFVKLYARQMNLLKLIYTKQVILSDWRKSNLLELANINKHRNFSN